MFDWANPNIDLFGNSINSALVATSYDTAAPSWVDSITGILGSAANAYSTIKTADSLNHQQVAPNGLQYVNGQFSAGNDSLTPLILLAGAGLVLFLFLKD